MVKRKEKENCLSRFMSHFGHVEYETLVGHMDGGIWKRAGYFGLSLKRERDLGEKLKIHKYIDDN